MHTLPLSEFRANASAALDMVEQGQTVRILRHGKPVADLVPVVEKTANAVVHVPSWKRTVTPVSCTHPDGKTAAQLIVEEREASPW